MSNCPEKRVECKEDHVQGEDVLAAPAVGKSAGWHLQNQPHHRIAYFNKDHVRNGQTSGRHKDFIDGIVKDKRREDIKKVKFPDIRLQTVFQLCAALGFSHLPPHPIIAIFRESDHANPVG